jgi:glycosyltransferase involved in cell wall biosynthesis
MLDPSRTVLHVTSDDEATFSTLQVPNIRVTNIPNAVDLPELGPGRVWRPDGILRLLYMGRLSREKGIENLLDALTLLDDLKLQVTVAGSGQPAYVRLLKDRASRSQLDEKIQFLGHIEGREKETAFRTSDVCVVPSFIENYGIVVAEALANGLPVIASTGTPWRVIAEQGCGLWVENSPPQLARAIRDIQNCNLAEMGAKGRELISSHYSWDDVAARMHDSYRYLLEKRHSTA